MNSIIHLNEVSKTYKVKEKGEASLLKRLFSPQTYKEVRAVKKVSLCVQKGEALGLIGNNGAGKSTLIKMMTGILYPTSGTVRVLGNDPFNQRLVKNRQIGVVFGQRTQLKWDLSPLESFKLLKCIYQIDGPVYRHNVGLFMDLFNMESFIKNPVRSLSLGQRMKCEIAAAFLHNPSMVFLDEPTIGLDVFSKEAIGDFLRQMKQKGITLVLTTHDLEEISKICDCAVVIHQGEILLKEKIEHLMAIENRQRALVFTLKNKIPSPLTLTPPIKAVYGDYTIRVNGADNGAASQVISQVLGSNQVVDFTFESLNFTQIIKKYLEG